MFDQQPKAAIHPELLRLMETARTPANEATERFLSDQIATHLGPVAQRLQMVWKTAPNSSKRKPRLYAQPKEYFALEGGLDQFAEAVAALAEGSYQTTSRVKGTVIHYANASLAGVDVHIELVLFEHEDHAECARLLPGLIDRFRT